MRTISKWFWAILQHISAPSEKEIRESLIRFCLFISLMAPAQALPLTPDQAEVRAQEELEFQYSHDADSMELIFNDKVLEDLKEGKYTHRLYLGERWSEQAITLFKTRLERTNWDVYDDLSPKYRTLKIVRHNTIPE